MNRLKINDKDYNLLFDACDSGNVKLIKAVCDYEMINYQNDKGYTLLAISCMRNDILMIKTIMKFLPDPNIKTNDGFSPLMFAIKNNNLEVVKLLVENGAITNEQKGVGSCLLYACSYGFFEIIDYLVNNKAKIKSMDSDKNNLLMIASKEGHLKIVKYLIEKKIDINQINKKGMNALMFAVIANNIDIVKELIKNDININDYNKDGLTALMFAVKYKRYNIINELLSHPNLDVNQIDYDGNTALMHACIIEDIKSIAFLLSNKKTNINKSNHENETALMIAIKKNNEEITTLLLAKMADVKIKNINGENAFKIAALNGNYKLAKLVMDYSVDDYELYDKELIENYKKYILDNEKIDLLKNILDNDQNLYEKIEEMDFEQNPKLNLNVNTIKFSNNVLLEKKILPNTEPIDLIESEVKLNQLNKEEIEIFKIDNKLLSKTLDKEKADEQINIMNKIDDSIIKIQQKIKIENQLNSKYEQSWLDLNIKEQRSILNNKDLSILEKMEKWIMFVEKTKVEWAPYDRYFNQNELIIIDNNNLKIDNEKYQKKIFTYWEKIKNSSGV